MAALVLLPFALAGCPSGESRSASESGEPPPAGPVPAVDAVEEVRPFRGMMTYLADGARFTDCRTGASFAMAREGDYPAAERAYRESLAQGKPLLISFDGRATRRPGMEGGEVDAVVVTDFGEAEPGLGCGGDVVTAPLEGTEWRLVGLPGAPDPPARAMATLLLDPETKTSSGSTGCNRFSGAYRLQGPLLTVGVGSVTRMACPGAFGTLETDFLEAVRVAGQYRFRNGYLELLGEVGPVARFAPPER